MVETSKNDLSFYFKIILNGKLLIINQATFWWCHHIFISSKQRIYIFWLTSFSYEGYELVYILFIYSLNFIHSFLFCFQIFGVSLQVLRERECISYSWLCFVTSVDIKPECLVDRCQIDLLNFVCKIYIFDIFYQSVAVAT